MANKLARRAVIARNADRLVAAGIPRDKLWNAHRNVVRLIYYRRDFASARRLLWDYWKEHPRDVRMLAYACITLLPPSIVADLRGRLNQPIEDSTGANSAADCAGWQQALEQIREDLAS
jgi:hypothetical protein